MRLALLVLLSLTFGADASWEVSRGSLQFVSRKMIHEGDLTFPLITFQYELGKDQGRVEIQDLDGLVYLTWVQAQLLSEVASSISTGQEKESADAIYRSTVRHWDDVSSKYLEGLARLKELYARSRDSASQMENTVTAEYFEARRREIEVLLRLVQNRSADKDMTYADLDEIGKWFRLYASAHPQPVQTANVLASNDQILESEVMHLFRMDEGVLRDGDRLGVNRFLFSNLPLLFHEAIDGKGTTVRESLVKTVQRSASHPTR